MSLKRPDRVTRPHSVVPMVSDEEKQVFKCFHQESCSILVRSCFGEADTSPLHHQALPGTNCHITLFFVIDAAAK
jgi:hypothetical protein